MRYALFLSFLSVIVGKCQCYDKIFNNVCQDEFVVKTKDGLIQGFPLKTVTGKQIAGFQSIPYAEPPVGLLRFRDPVKSLPWKGKLKAIASTPLCTQVNPMNNNKIVGQEDCLYLSVYTFPNCSLDKLLPVMVWFHGGDFYHGASAYYGPRYLLEEKVVLVTVNYRLGPFGFLSTGDLVSPGNQGQKDQVLALKWVRDNIQLFGGDPNSITIFGESSGGPSVGLHIVSPMSKGLFHRSIQQSGSAFCYWIVENNGTDVAMKTARLFGCPINSSDKLIACLQEVPQYELVTAETALMSWYGPFRVFGPNLEPEHPGAFITKPVLEYYKSGEAANVPVIIGVNSNEGGSWASGFLTNQTQVDHINTNWTNIGPDMMGIQEESNATEKAAQIWDFYMSGRNFSFETRINFSDLYGDRTLVEGAIDAMIIHTKYTKAPVYAYEFTYKGRFSTVTGRPQDWGVVHIDELIYLLNSTVLYPTSTLNESDPEIKMSQLMTKLWTNFAKFGEPILDSDGLTTKMGWNLHSSKNMWKSVKLNDTSESDTYNFQFLNLTLNPAMISNPFARRYKFWKDLERNVFL